MKTVVTRRLWLTAFGGTLVSHVTGCVSSAQPRSVIGAARTTSDPEPSIEPLHPANAEPDSTPLVEQPEATREPVIPVLGLPERPAKAETGSAFLRRIEGLGRGAIDDQVLAQVKLGNVPLYQRRLCPITVTEGEAVRATLYVMCDYLAIGSDKDFIRMPMTSAAAQQIANLLDASLPTTKLVDLIYAQAEARLPPSYIEGGPTDDSLEDFAVHHKKLEERRLAKGYALGVLTAGHKKDIVLSVRMTEREDRVAIYGWHKKEGDIIQPLSCRHSCRYADYSHGVRLVAQAMTVNGEDRRFSEVLRDPEVASLVSDEGRLDVVAYPTVLPAYEPTKSDKKKKKK